MMPTPRSLFEPDLPGGFVYQPEFITSDDEARLLEEISRLQFSTFEMRGVVARRRVAFFGQSYDAGPAATPDLPPFLLTLRARIAPWAGLTPDAFAMALVNEYPPGAPIGWHRDAPQYEMVAGLSLLTACRMKLRPYLRPSVRSSTHDRPRTATHELVLEPRSAYLIKGRARNDYEHHIPPVTALRYSITFRTLRS